jgi:hypothetical protein
MNYSQDPACEVGKPIECLSIYVELTKEQQIEPKTGEMVEKVGFRIGGGIDQDPSDSPFHYPDRVSYRTFKIFIAI